MKSIIFALMLAMIPVKAHAFGWFLLGYAVGSDDSSSTQQAIKNPANSTSFIEVQSCHYDRDKTIIRTSLITAFRNSPKKNRVEVYTVKGYSDYCLFNTSLKKVKAKYFPVKSK